MKTSSKASIATKNFAPVRTMLQKTHGKPKPVREHKRFIKGKVADTGEDPTGGFLHFMKSDINAPLERASLIESNVNMVQASSNKWAIRTTKQCPAIEKLPKLQQYREYNFPERSQEDVDRYKSFYLKSDNISIRVPELNKKDYKDSFLNLKTKFGPHTETIKDGWVPQGNFKTMNNRSSVSYNIINPSDNATSSAIVLKILDHKVTNKKKGVAEISDLTRAYNPNFNSNYKELLNENKSVFHRYNGIFSHMYDAAHRNGNIVVPFRNHDLVHDSHKHKSPQSGRKKSPKRE